ncbi:HAD family hydrolase [Egibacter rhizosphaerae]|uniref:HAD family hydrolase n=1 Tax=Egibacter rhizosphaerae TaxID=1670831 RepID=A0A411YA94_9ACTN|nr:HAD family hydrolase [Egibacter rhizosphaerae]QBI18115.1 HAD family hydrolase [Egibacter rhizosphaerae]
MVEWIALDGDDTLWHSQDGFEEVEALFREIVAEYVDPDTARAELYATEAANMSALGYGAKAFTISLVETALRLSRGSIPATELDRLLDAGKGLLTRPTRLLDGAAGAVEELAGRYRLLLVTKGDLVHQERKVAESGLAEHLDRIAIVSEKDHDTYRQLLAEEGAPAQRFLMAGNSLRSDVLPVLEVGAWAAYVPYAWTWVHEQVPDGAPDGVPVLSSLAELPGLVAELAAA